MDDFCLFSDIDYVEYDYDGKIYAMLEVTGECNDEGHMINKMKYTRLRMSRRAKVFSQIAKSLHIPFYMIVYDNSMSIFHIYTIVDKLGGDGNLYNYMRMDGDQHKQFIHSLRK